MNPQHHSYHTEPTGLAPEEARPPLRLLRGEATLHDLVADILRGLRALAEAGLDVPHTLTTTATGLQLVVGDFTPPAPRQRPAPAEAPPQGDPAPYWYSDWTVFSDLEREILLLLLDEGGQSRREIATHLDKSAEGLLGNVLANLAAREILHSSNDGYKLNMIASRRAGFRDWLAAQPERRPAAPHKSRRGAVGLVSDNGPDEAELAARIEAARAEKRGATS
jgi:hypothetical protein